MCRLLPYYLERGVSLKKRIALLICSVCLMLAPVQALAQEGAPSAVIRYCREQAPVSQVPFRLYLAGSCQADGRVLWKDEVPKDFPSTIPETLAWDGFAASAGTLSARLPLFREQATNEDGEAAFFGLLPGSVYLVLGEAKGADIWPMLLTVSGSGETVLLDAKYSPEGAEGGSTDKEPLDEESPDTKPPGAEGESKGRQEMLPQTGMHQKETLLACAASLVFWLSGIWMLKRGGRP